ncbi:MAG: hypothetical protein LBG42_00025 [Treponema sp.]|jgi:hypothetical protein|nr:hypothetical protein [Treponema sp.]
MPDLADYRRKSAKSARLVKEPTGFLNKSNVIKPAVSLLCKDVCTVNKGMACIITWKAYTYTIAENPAGPATAVFTPYGGSAVNLAEVK